MYLLAWLSWRDALKKVACGKFLAKAGRKFIISPGRPLGYLRKAVFVIVLDF